MKKKIAQLTAGLALGIFYFFSSLSVWATPFSVTLADTPGPLNGGSLSYTIDSPVSGAATLTFDLLGYLSVDGLQDPYTDTFRLTVNGSELFNGGFNMGGGGSTFINHQDPGVTFSTQVYSTWQYYYHDDTEYYDENNWYWSLEEDGGLTSFIIAHTLLAGPNTYIFNYGEMQGLYDEGWGLQSAVITADDPSSPVPEPSTVVLLGLGLAGIAVVRKKFRMSNPFCVPKTSRLKS